MVESFPPPAAVTGSQDAAGGRPRVRYEMEEPNPGADPEGRYRTLIERMADMVMVFGTDYEIYYVNPAGLTMLGADRADQVVGHLASEFAHPSYDPGTERHVSMWQDLSGVGHTSETIGVRVDGSCFDSRVTILTTVWEGRPALLAVGRDVTAEHAAEAERARYKDRIARLLESSAEGVVGLDPHGICTFVNPSAAAAVGSTPEAIVGRSWHELFHHSHRDGSPYPAGECAVLAAVGEGRQARVDLDWFWRTDGTAFPVQTWSQPVAEDGIITGALLNFVDISERIAGHDQLATSEARFRAVFDGAATGIAITGPDGRVVAANAAMGQMLGSSPADLEGLSIRELAHPDDPGSSVEYSELVAGRLDSYEIDKCYRLRDGRTMWVRLRVAAVRDDDAALKFVVTVMEDVTAARGAADVLAASERRFRSAFHDLGTGMILAGADGTVLEVNRAVCELFGCSSEELVGGNWLERVHLDDVDRVLRAAYRLLDGELSSSASEHRSLGPDGRELCVISTASLLENEDGSPLFLLQVQDITERKRAQAELSFDASHDQLTRLPNRLVLLDHLSAALRRHCDTGDMVAVLFVDLDHFKLVNDSYGHVVGDEVLVALAERLRRTAGPEALVVRFAGDEFVVLTESSVGEQHAVELARRLSDAIAEPLIVEAGEMQLTASIGIAYGHSGELDPDLVLRDADLAMFEAKARGRARSTVFDDALRGRARYRLETARALRLALEQDELVLHYQPVIDMRTEVMTGVEALVRWEHPIHGLISPGEFMPVAEETGLVVNLGAWVLDEACRQGAEWDADPALGPIVVSVNLSARQFNDDALVPRVARALQSSGLASELLCLEITESAVMEDVVHTGEVLAELRALGVTLSIDDFGTGYSSLSYLKQFPVDHLKIDRSFVDGLGSESEDTQIVTAVVHLAHALGLTVVAEGVETTEQLEVLRGLECERVQGYLIARPQPAAALTTWLLDRQAMYRSPADPPRSGPSVGPATVASRPAARPLAARPMG